MFELSLVINSRKAIPEAIHGPLLDFCNPKYFDCIGVLSFLRPVYPFLAFCSQ